MSKYIYTLYLYFALCRRYGCNRTFYGFTAFEQQIASGQRNPDTGEWLRKAASV